MIKPLLCVLNLNEMMSAREMCCNQRLNYQTLVISGTDWGRCIVLNVTGFCCEMLLFSSNEITTWPIIFSFLFSVLHNPLCVCLLSLDFSSIETINTVNESINTVCYTSLLATAMMHCSVNPPCSPAMDGWIGSLSADLSVTLGRPAPAATYTEQLIQSK